MPRRAFWGQEKVKKMSWTLVFSQKVIFFGPENGATGISGYRAPECLQLISQPTPYRQVFPAVIGLYEVGCE
jgi:hypothetical protein